MSYNGWENHMKCIYCGAELKPGCIYCSRCGKEIQLVPDYSAIEDDYLNLLIHPEESSDSTRKQTSDKRTEPSPHPKEQREPKESKEQTGSQKNRQTKRPPEKKSAGEKKKNSKKKWIIGGIAAAVIVAAAGISVAVHTNLKAKQNNSAAYQIEKARDAENEGNLSEAVRFYEKALQLEPSDTDTMLSLAVLYEKQKNYEEACTKYLAVLAKDSSNETACKNLIAIYEKQKDYDAILALSKTVNSSLSDLFSDYLVETPEFSKKEGTYDEFIQLRLSASSGCRIYYTTNGKDPVRFGEEYEKPIALDELKSYVIKAVAVNDKDIYSEVVSNRYKIDIPAPDMPAVSPDGGNFGAETTVTISVPDNCSAYYTWDGTDPDDTSEPYTEPITVPEGNNVLSVILIDNQTGLSSSIYRGNFVYFR